MFVRICFETGSGALYSKYVKNLHLFLIFFREINGLTKTWVIADPELIKKIFVKEFECFAGRMVSDLEGE